MEEKPKKTIASLGSIADSIRRSSGPQKKYTEPERVIEIQRPYFPPAAPKPISIRLDNLRRLDEDALMKLLTKEVGDDKRPLDDGTKMAITMELMRRQAKRTERPAWWKDPYFWIAAAGALFAGIAAYPVLFADRPALPQPIGAASKSVPVQTKSLHSTAGPPPSKVKSPADTL